MNDLALHCSVSYVGFMAKTKPFSMRLPPELKAELQKLAAAENRSLTNFIETRLWEIVRGARK